MNFDVGDAIQASREGRYAEALEILEGMFGQIDSGLLEYRGNQFITVFAWSQLIEEYLPAREAMARTRDEQISRLLHGEEIFGDPLVAWPKSRFHVIVELNDILEDYRSTYELFVQWIAIAPTQARREAFLALPAIVANGDFALADSYLGDPLAQLDELNRLACDFPLYPSVGTAPRLGAELSNFMKDVRLRVAILRGLGREEEAEVLQSAALAGLVRDDMRGLGIRELAAPGAIFRDITSHQDALDGAA